MCSGPAVGVVAGSKLPSYCIMSKTLAVARRIESLGEGMRIHISEVRDCVIMTCTIKHLTQDSKQLLDKVGGFRCDYHGTLELGVSLDFVKIFSFYQYICCSVSRMRNWTHFG